MRTVRLLALLLIALMNLRCSGCLTPVARAPEFYAATSDAGPGNLDAGCPVRCGASCCKSDETCIDGRCQTGGLSNCEGRECGPDGVGGLCGECQAGFDCLDDRCLKHCGTDAELCARSNAECGSLAVTDDCGTARVLECGNCEGPFTCTVDHRCMIRDIPWNDAQLCAEAGYECGPLTTIDNVGMERHIGSCGECVVPKNCAAGRCTCTGESDADLCLLHGTICGPLATSDQCGTWRYGIDCGTCAIHQTCSAGSCLCIPETDAELCRVRGIACGALSTTDRCGKARSISDCAPCLPTERCVLGGCECRPESDAELCLKASIVCGFLTRTDGCGGSRVISDCGPCGAHEFCTSGHCVCAPETDAQLCSSHVVACGPLSATDVCGASRAIAECGPCGANHRCTAGACQCVPETDAELCTAAASACGPVSRTDRCGVARTVTECGLCASRMTCSAGACAPCAPESDSAFCARLAACGTKTDVDNCGTSRTVNDCACLLGQTCRADGRCATTPGNDTCAGAQALVFNRGMATITGDLDNANDDAQGSCASAGGRDLVYALTLPAPVIWATVTPSSPGASADAVYLRRTCNLPDTEQACGNDTRALSSCVGSVANLSTTELPPGTYYLWVDGSGTFTLTVIGVWSDPIPLPGGCGAPMPLLFSASGTAEVVFNTIGSSNNLSGACAPMPGPDMTYSVTLPSSGVLEATVNPGPYCSSLRPAIYVRSSCSDGSAASEKVCVVGNAGSLFARTPLLGPGTYFVTLDTIAPSQDETLFLRLDYHPVPANDTCAGATVVTLPDTGNPVTIPVDTRYATDDPTRSCVGNGAPNLFYRVDRAQWGGFAGGFTATLTSDTGSSLLPALQLRRDCSANAPTRACATGPSASTTMPYDGCGVGSVYLVVDGNNGTMGTGVLTFTPLGIPPPGQLCCGDAAILTFGSNGVATTVGSTATSWRDRRGSCPSDGADVVYEFTIAAVAGGSVRATVTPGTGSSAQHSVYVETRPFDCSGGYEVGAAVAPSGGSPAVLTIPSLMPGDYYVFVDGATTSDTGPFTLSVELGPP